MSDYWAVPFLATMHRIAAEDMLDGGRAGPDGRHRHRAAGYTRFRPACAGRAGAPRRGQRGTGRPGRPPGPAYAEGLELGLLDAGVDTREVGRPRRPEPSSTRPSNRALAPGSWPSGRSCCSTAGTTLPLDPRACASVAVIGPCGSRFAYVHGLLRLPQPRAAALSQGRGHRHRGAEPAVDALRSRACRQPRSSMSRAARCIGRRPVRVRGRGRGGPENGRGVRGGGR